MRRPALTRARSSPCLAAGGILLLAGWLWSGPLRSRPAAAIPDLGPCASLHGRPVFPPDNPWNQEVSRWAVDPASATLIASLGADKPLHPDFGAPLGGQPIGIPYVVVDADRVAPAPVTFQYREESDPGPYPLPPDAPIEGGPHAAGDRHVLVVDRRRWRLYELDEAYPEAGGTRWRAVSGAVFDLAVNSLRPAGWTSADAAGLPIFPGLVRYDEVRAQGVIRHALRFTCVHTRRACLPPATHFASASDDPRLPPMGLRVRLQASFDVGPYPPAAQIILTALKTYGMILADNGSDWFVSGAPDARWDNEELAKLKRVKGGDFEVVRAR